MTDGGSHAARRRGMLAVLLALLSAAGLYAFWLSHTPLGVGWYRDDGVYVVTAKAIAEGRGPRLDYLPGAPRMTKYPLLWPGVLAGVIVVGDADRARLTGPLVVLPNAVFLPLAPGKTLRTFYLSGAGPDLDRAARAVFRSEDYALYALPLAPPS